MTANGTPGDSRVIVCGGASGIGATIAQTFANAGARVGILDASARPASLQSTIAYAQCDATNALAVEGAFAALRTDLGVHDVLVNCIRYRTPANADATDLDRALAVDFTTYVHAAHAFCIANQRARQPGAVVNVSSILATLVAPSQSLAYHAAKAAIEQLTRYLAVTFGPAGIRVNAVAPGLISRGAAEAASGAASASAYAKIARVVPLRRSGTAAEVAAAVAFLASDAASFITGQTLIVDGGLAVREQADIAVHLPDETPA